MRENKLVSRPAVHGLGRRKGFKQFGFINRGLVRPLGLIFRNVKAMVQEGTGGPNTANNLLPAPEYPTRKMCVNEMHQPYF